MGEAGGPAWGGTWVDPETGLEWQREAPEETMTWHRARRYAAALRLAGHGDWRLPEAAELESLFDRSRYRPVVRGEVPFRDEGDYWSSTTFAARTRSAWIVRFGGAYVLSYDKSNRYRVRCVRGGGRPGRRS